MTMTKRFLMGFLAICISFSMMAQSPWARKKAGLYAQAGYYFIPAYGDLFGSNGKDIILDRKVSERQFQLYGEYGVTNKTTFVLSLPIVWNERGESNPDSPYLFAEEYTGSIAGLGNTTLAVRHQFLSSKVALAGTLKVGLPAGVAYKPQTDLRTGYGAVTVQPMVSAGMGFRKTYGFLYGSYGYRSNDYSHFLNFGAETGIHIGKFWLIGFSDFVYSLENGDKPLPALDVLTGLYVNNQGWLSIGAKAIWAVNRFVGITVSGTGAVWAQNVPKSPGVGASVYFKWD